MRRAFCHLLGRLVPEYNLHHAQSRCPCSCQFADRRASRTVADPDPGPGTHVVAGRRTAARDPIQTLVGRLDLERYKATIKGLTQFGDRRQGTDRNRAAVDWIEAQLKSYGCPTERIKYEYVTPQRGTTAGGQRGGRGAGGGRGASQGNKRPGQGGSTIFGTAGRTGVNNDPNLQPDEKLRALNTQAATDGPREEVYCTKVGSKTPGEMYIIGAHMDGYGWGEAANDDGSGTALVMELARIFSSPDVQTDRTIRFALWNNEETGLNGARAYVDSGRRCRGKRARRGRGSIPSRSGWG